MPLYSLWKKKAKLVLVILVFWVALTISKISLAYHTIILLLVYINACSLPGAVPCLPEAGSFHLLALCLIPWSRVHSEVHERRERITWGKILQARPRIVHLLYSRSIDLKSVTWLHLTLLETRKIILAVYQEEENNMDNGELLCFRMNFG